MEGKTISKLLVIAGAGNYPRLVIEGAKRAGVPCVTVARVLGSTDRATLRAADEIVPVSIPTLAADIRHVGTLGFDGVVMAGQINPLSLFRGRFDREVQGWLDELHVKTAHTIFSKLIEKLTENGLNVLPASMYMENNLPGVGPLTARGFTAEEQSDIDHAMAVVRDIGIHDVGQTVMVKHGMVLAVEAFEGTNNAIKRGGKLGGRGSVLFKAARVGHDMRFDIPVIGLKTLKVMHKVGVTAIGFQAGRQILLDREAVIAYANSKNIAIVGVESGLPPAPTRP